MCDCLKVCSYDKARCNILQRSDCLLTRPAGPLHCVSSFPRTIECSQCSPSVHQAVLPPRVHTGPGPRLLAAVAPHSQKTRSVVTKPLESVVLDTQCTAQPAWRDAQMPNY